MFVHTWQVASPFLPRAHRLVFPKLDFPNDLMQSTLESMFILIVFKLSVISRLPVNIIKNCECFTKRYN
jgi:hypothetical protein